MTISSLATTYPLGFIVLVSLVVTLATTLIYKKFTNQHELKQLKERLSGLQKNMRENKHDEKKMLEIQKELAEKNLEYMKHSFKPLFITFLPLLLIFWWLRNLYGGITGHVLSVPGTSFGLSWIWTYIVFSIIFSLVLRKVLKIY